MENIRVSVVRYVDKDIKPQIYTNMFRMIEWQINTGKLLLKI